PLPANARPRVVVADILDQTENGLTTGLKTSPASRRRGTPARTEPPDREEWLLGLHDVLVTGMVNAGAFSVLERKDLPALDRERAFAAAAGDQVLSAAALEGADILLLPSITSFEPAGGGALPLPIPVSDDGDFIILWLRGGTAEITMDMRLVDVASGRVLRATAVRGKARSYRADLDAFVLFGDGYVTLPGVLGFYNNTALHAALVKMVNAAVSDLARGVVAGVDDIPDARTRALFRGAAAAQAVLPTDDEPGLTP
ncbi:MAG: CsgG/HfaB family protein, partial [Oceanococcaceae bacterium]